MRLLQTALLVLLPTGGQQTSRRNAWSGMVDDAARGRARREAEAALDRAAQAPSRERRAGV